MNTNGNVYTIIYTTVIVAVVAAILSFAAMSLKSRQDANIKAETISQMLTAAQYFTKEECSAMGNDKVLEEYSKNIKEAYIIDAGGRKVRNLDLGKRELADGLKAFNKAITSGKNVELPVYVFNKDGKDVSVLPVYGGGLWGPVWGYIALDSDLKTIIGAYFDHESETPGLGAKIKDNPDFRAQFAGKEVDINADPVFEIVKGGAPAGQKNAVDAITGATMTTKGLSAAIATWLKVYIPYLSTPAAPDAVAAPADTTPNVADSTNVQ